MTTKKQFPFYVNFESYLKLGEKRGLSDIGEYTVVRSQKGHSKKVMVYDVFELTDEEYMDALYVMHQIANRYGHNFKAANIICEEVKFNLPYWSQMRAQEKADKEARELRQLEMAMNMFNAMFERL